MMDRRSREKVLLAASNVQTKEYRQAACIGAIAQVLMDTGHFLPQQVAALAADRMGWGLSVAADMNFNPFPKGGYPSMPEIRKAAELFKAQYDPPPLGVAV